MEIAFRKAVSERHLDLVSVREVAKLAGVSPATVSRVFSNSAHAVTDGTRTRVLQAVEELNWRPNLVARSLVTSRTTTLGAIVHDISDPYFGEIVRGLEDGAREAGYQVFACSSDRDPETELSYVERLMAHRVDALVFAGGGIKDRGYRKQLRTLLDEFREHGGVVIALAPTSYRGAVSASPDNAGAAADMVRHLLEFGHRRIAFVSGPQHIQTSEVRERGYEQALLEAGVDPDPDLVASGAFTVQGGEEAAHHLLDARPDITAIFAANDLMACGALRALADRGLDVPADVSVAGFDDIQMAMCVRPRLTTIRMDMYAMGTEGARLALAHLGGDKARPARLPTEVVVRESTASRKRKG